MMYLFHGSDEGKVREKAFAWVAAARAKEPNLVYARLSREELTAAALEDAAAAGGLFVRRLLILLDDPFSKTDEEDDEHAPDVLEMHLDALAKSDNAIVILAPKLPAAKAKRLAEKVAKAYEYNEPARGLAARVL